MYTHNFIRKTQRSLIITGTTNRQISNETRSLTVLLI